MPRALATTLPALVFALAGMAPVAAQNPPSSSNPSRAGLTTITGLRVGHHTLMERPTGCTVVLVDGDGATGGVSQRGGAPGTSETDLLGPLNQVDKVNAVVLSGGSAFGLDARQGVVRYLEEHKIGWNVGAAGVVPIVPAAILFDLGFGGDPKIRPTADCGYRAAAAASNGPVAEGNVGAGAGATVGKMSGAGTAMKGGIGTASVTLPNGLAIAALVAVNAAGDVIDPLSGQIVAGVRTADGKTLADARALLRSGSVGGAAGGRPGVNTTIAVVATNARMSKADINRVALMADDGLARAIRPSHTTSDGDTVFALATGRWQGQTSVTVVGALAADVLAEAVVRAVVQARASGGLPAARDLGTVPARFR